MEQIQNFLFVVQETVLKYLGLIHHSYCLDNTVNIIIVNIVFIILFLLTRNIGGKFFSPIFEYRHPVLISVLPYIPAAAVAFYGLRYITAESSYTNVYYIAAGWAVGIIICDIVRFLTRTK